MLADRFWCVDAFSTHRRYPTAVNFGYDRSMTDARRTRSHAGGARGLDFQSIPMRLFQKGKRLAWDPMAIDLSGDRRDWEATDEGGREGLIGIAASFLVGEEAVTLDLLPLLHWMARAGRVEDEIYLTSFLYEEAKHTEFFRRWLDEVAGAHADFTPPVGSAARRIFLEELPVAMNALYEDDSAQALARAMVTYNMVIEGVLAETGYDVYRRVLQGSRTYPGLLEAITYVARDESRHLRFASYVLQGLIRDDPSLWGPIQGRMDELLELVVAMHREGHEQGLARAREQQGGDLPPEAEMAARAYHEGIVQFSRQLAARRLRVLERALDSGADELEPELEEALP
jgi:ribonucleoside-diphosphate reductase beta chain